MVSINELTAELDAVLAILRRTLATIDRATASWERAAGNYGQALAGSVAPAADELSQLDEAARSSLDNLRQVVSSAVGAVQAYRTPRRPGQPRTTRSIARSALRCDSLHGD